MTKKRLAIFGGSFNPPGTHHRALAAALAERFDEVVILPCGGRDDKPSVATEDSLHRAIMTDLSFQGLPGVRVDRFDLENENFMRTFEVERHFSEEGEVWHALGTDLLLGGGTGSSPLHGWEHGADLWANSRFIAVTREGFELPSEDLPPHHEVVRAPLPGSSTDIRRLAGNGQPVTDLATPEVEAHIRRYGLYSGRPSTRTTVLETADPRPFIIADGANPRAVETAARFAAFEDRGNPNMILVCGGDGMMLHSIQEHWSRRLPFVGVNAGRRGYLMNDPAAVGDDPAAFLTSLRISLQTMLLVEVVGLDGEKRSFHAFNDAWLERDSGQSAWLEVRVGGETKLSRLVADGALIATPAGSTSYARAMGASPLLADAPALLLVGNNVLEPLGWKSAILPDTAEVEMLALDAAKRPVRAFVDGRLVGRAVSMSIRRSRVAAAEIGFRPGRDMAAKLMEGLFPPVA
jgi:nicotinate (nicotinamide) nucleotide adenylyltransferase